MDPITTFFEMIFKAILIGALIIGAIKLWAWSHTYLIEYFTQLIS